MRAPNTIGPRGPRIAFATSRKGPQPRLLAYALRRETQPVGIPQGSDGAPSRTVNVSDSAKAERHARE